MSLILTILAIIVGVGLLLFIGLGLAIVFGILMIGLVVVGLISLVFSPGSSCTGIGSNHNADRIPQEFNHCLLNDDLETCRTHYTVWTPDQAKLVGALAKQVRDDLGERLDDSSRSTQFSQNSVNGDTTVFLTEETDFAKKKGVRESYVLVTDPKDQTLKIKELNWDYTALTTP